jgi:hypothetical protein
MKKLFILVALLSSACGNDDAPARPDAAPDVDAPPVTPPEFVQVEHLARPGINEALLISEGFLAGYNATAPTFTGVPTDVLNQVIGEAKTVLKALYLGTCLLNGVAGLTPQTGLHPAGKECHAVGAAVFEADGVTQTAASITNSQQYADLVFGQFIPDVMRIDTGVASAYLTPCGDGPVLLCGGRFVRDDVIDVTYDYLLNGAATCGAGLCGAPNQVNALVSDGVVFDNVTASNNTQNRQTGDPANRQQGHPNVANEFPYSAAPL